MLEGRNETCLVNRTDTNCHDRMRYVRLFPFPYDVLGNLATLCKLNHFYFRPWKLLTLPSHHQANLLFYLSTGTAILD